MSLPDPPPNAAGVPWPILDPAALYGLAGEVVELLDPHTEADRVSVLTSFLTAYGAMAGPGVGERPHAMADSALHPARLFNLHVGPTAKARKGSGWQGVKRILMEVDPEFMGRCVKSGFGSGEALVAELAFADTCDDENEGDDDDHHETRSHDVPVGPDKRILLIEPEFARVLAAGGWQGSTMSSIFRQAWDGDSLQLRVRRQKPLIATEPHVTVIGHITVEELRIRLNDADLFSGYVNRFLPFCVRRSKILPSGGCLDQEAIDRLARKINRRLKSVRDVGLMTRSPLAEKLWEKLYHQMAEDDPGGLVGAAVARAEAQVLRLSVVYALTGGSPVIKTYHLKAAWALWSYARASASYIFEDGTGSKIADVILAAAKTAGRTGISRTEISDLLGRHQSAKEIDLAVELLLRKEVIEGVPPKRGKGRTEKRIRVRKIRT